VSDVDEARVLFDQAREAADDQRLGDAIAAFDDLIRRFDDAPDLELQWLVGDALYAKGYTLQRLEREEDALAVYEQMALRYGERSEFRGQLSRALLQRGWSLARLERRDEAIAVWDEMIARFDDAREPPLAMGLAAAFEGKAAALRGLERLDDAAQAYDEVVLRFTDSRFPPLRRSADTALSNKVFVLLLQGRHDEAIVVANAAVERLGEADDADALAIAVLNLGGALAQEQRFEEALDVYDLLLPRLEEAGNRQLRGHLMLAISNKVEVLVSLGREDEAVRIHTEMLDTYGDEVAKAFRDAAARNEHDEGAAAVVAGMLLKAALVLAELGEIDRSLVSVNELISRFEKHDAAETKRVVAMALDLRQQLLEDDDGP